MDSAALVATVRRPASCRVTREPFALARQCIRWIGRSLYTEGPTVGCAPVGERCEHHERLT